MIMMNEEIQVHSQNKTKQQHNKTVFIFYNGLIWFINVKPSPSTQLPAQTHPPSAGAALNKGNKYKSQKKKGTKRQKRTQYKDTIAASSDEGEAKQSPWQLELIMSIFPPCY